jgi:phospholipid/cholesterol/gamma-HCH transport system ATP-binding protein
MMSDGLRLDGIEKAFADNPVLRGVSLALPEGTSTALIGRSASGKSVLLKCAAGLLPIDRGRIDVLGTADVDDWSLLRARVGILFQRNALFDSMLVWENVAFPLRRQGMAKATAKAEAIHLLSLVDLDERAALGFPKDLSGGMQKRAALARAIAGSPDLMLLDDPTAGLDPVMAASVEQLIRHLIRRENATALIVTADVHNLPGRFDRVAVLDRGEITWNGPATDLPASAHPLLQAA